MELPKGTKGEMMPHSVMASVADLVDRLSIENIKCYHANENILVERRKESPDPQVIANLEFKARSAGEMRVALKGEINQRLDPSAKVETRTYILGNIK